MSLPDRDKNVSASPLPPQTAGRAAAPPSLWLYMAGLCVTLSGLYAVCYELESSAYRFAALLIAGVGYAFSFLARRSSLPLRTVQTVGFAAIAALIVFAASTPRGLNALLPLEAQTDHAKAWQILIAWVAIAQTFTLTSDAAVLFACVPSMTLIALVSTLASDLPMQNIFLAFVGAATFLMVHENYLRTQAGGGNGQAAPGRALRGQAQLALLCVVSSLALAKIAVVPIKIVGQTLFLPSAVSALNNGQGKLSRLASLNGELERNDTLDIATGPVNPGEQPVMRVECEPGLDWRGHYWRGATFDRYTGSSFENTEKDWVTVPTAEPRHDWNALSRYRRLSPEAEGQNGQSLFVIPDLPFELPDTEMRDSRETTLHITTRNGRSAQIYGAGRIERIRLAAGELHLNPVGSVTTGVMQPSGQHYTVVSRVTDDDPAHLRAASSNPNDLPFPVWRHYARVKRNNPMLEELAAQITRGCSNNYDRVTAISNYISQTCKYNLQAPLVPRDQDVVAYFLFESKEGYCDCFAASLTMLCRYAGIPARLATGFLTGDYEDGAYLVKEKHRHAWTEVFFPQIGWVAFDATTGAEDISEAAQKGGRKPASFTKWLLSSGLLPPSLAVCSIGMLGLVIRNEIRARKSAPKSGQAFSAARTARNREVAVSYHAACAALKQRGLARMPDMTPDAYAGWLRGELAAELPEAVSIMQTLTELYAVAQYSGRPVTEAEAAQAKTAAARLRGLTRQILRRKPNAKSEATRGAV